jgi:hypothetical protein
MFEKAAGLLGFILLMGLYEKYKKKQESNMEQKHYDIVSKFLLNDDEYKMMNSGLPILWIFVDYRKNARLWENFGSRTSHTLNKPYQMITLKSIVKQASDDFHICFIDDDSFGKLLSGEWNYNLSSMPDPIKTNLRMKGLYMLLYKYGGFLLPSSYLALKPLKNIFNDNLSKKETFVGLKCNDIFTNIDEKYVPNTQFIGCKKHSEELKMIIEQLDDKLKKNEHFQNKQDFERSLSHMIYKGIYQGTIGCEDAKQIGVETNENIPVTTYDLFEGKENVFYNNLNGIYIPDDKLVTNHKFNWVLYLTSQDVMQMNNIISQYMKYALEL